MDVYKGKYCCKKKIRYDLGNLRISTSTQYFSKLTGVCGALMNTAPKDATYRSTF